MSHHRNLLPIIGIVVSLSLAAGICDAFSAQRPQTDTRALRSLEARLDAEWRADRGELFERILRSPLGMQMELDPDLQLVGVRDGRIPMYYATQNLIAAQSISTDRVWPGGGAGLSLTGSGTTLGGLALWDGGGVRTNHAEFGGRATQIDSPGGLSNHATHVAGTMIAAGVDPEAKGMSYEALIAAYDWNNDASEMAAAAANDLHVSNHSYGFVTGWRWNSSWETWFWYGDVTVSEVEDYGFGFYCGRARDWDEIAHNAPYYTICKSAGNERSDTGPDPGGGHYYWNPDIGDWDWSTVTREPDGGEDGYDSVGWNGTAKNILSVGAVHDIPGGYAGPEDVEVSWFSSWGPTDDGRIKPDLVANGVGLWSALASGNNDYASYSGTSMSSPNLSGSLNLLIRHYEETHDNTTPLSSTMKAVLIHTADEAGPHTGPDYMHGWGLMNTERAAQLIADNSVSPGYIREEVLANNSVHAYSFYSDGSEPVRVTIAWTDPPGTPVAPVLNPTDLMLVNDLDLRVARAGGDMYLPYILDPANPSAAATTGDNFRDNSEMVYIPNPEAGVYEVTVTHKGNIAPGQVYSLVMSSIEQPPDPEGACCFEDGSCLVLTEADCVAQEGVWEGADTVCDPNPCPQPPDPEGACCFEDGSCLVLTEADCVAQDGAWEGADTVCDPNPCPVLLGACCLDPDTCVLTIEEDCEGTFLGEGTVCDPNPCGVLDVGEIDRIPGRLQIGSLHPNPTTGRISFGIDLPAPARVTVRVVDVTGKVVSTLVNRDLGAGSHLISDTPTAESGARLQNGVYFLHLDAMGEQQVRKFIVAR